MNKNNINKLSLLLTGLQSRYEENTDIFLYLEVIYSSGLKEFKGTALRDKETGNLSYNFKGVTSIYSIDQLTNCILEDSPNYENIIILYNQRGGAFKILCDAKEVKMSTCEELSVKGEDVSHNYTKSSLLNRDYYIKSPKADPLLKEIGIMTSNGKIKNDMIRKYNQIDHYVELLEGILETFPQNKPITILDCGCGKSYLTFVLNYYLTEVKKRRVSFIGIDRSKDVIKRSKEMGDHLNYNNMEFYAMDLADFKPRKKIDIVISLHACDTATDMALACGIKIDAKVIIAVPCCHREFLSQINYEPFKSITKHGVFKSRLSDLLTDGMRSLMLEAHGYDVSCVEYISPLETPKNLMIRAVKVKEENPEASDTYMELMGQLNVYPTLYALLNEE